MSQLLNHLLDLLLQVRLISTEAAQHVLLSDGSLQHTPGALAIVGISSTTIAPICVEAASVGTKED